MLTCERCGAGLPPDRDQCAYCGTVSAPARAALQVEAAQHAQEQARVNAQQAVARQALLSATEVAASRALTWGLLSFVFYCLPICNVLSFLAYKRAQGSARAAGIPVPTRATTGLVCSLLTGVLCVGSWTWMITDLRAQTARVEAREAVLSQQISAHPDSPTLDPELACALAELYLLNNGFAGSTDTGSFSGLTCAGVVRVVKDRAELGDFRLRTSSTSDVKAATLCFKHGAHWFVESAGVVSCELKP